jgi:hypothetical protein
MSLEEALNRNTDAVMALIEMLRISSINIPAIPPVSPVAMSLDPTADELFPPPKQETAPPLPAPAATEIDYPTVAKAITTVFKADRQLVIDSLAKFGAKKGPELKPVDYAAFLKEIGQ